MAETVFADGIGILRGQIEGTFWIRRPAGAVAGAEGATANPRRQLGDRVGAREPVVEIAAMTAAIEA